MNRRGRRTATLVLTVAIAAATAAVTLPPTASATSGTPPDRPGQVRRFDSIGDTGPDRTAARVDTWPGRTIRYSETIPAKWQWGLDKAVAAWNSSGGRMKFVRTSPRRAQVTIGYGQTYGSDGYATVGRAPRGQAWVRLSPAYKKATADTETRVWVGRLFTHELGHVLGLWHSSGQCSLMVAIYDMSACPLLDSRPGYYTCRWIDRGALRKFTTLYGGKPRVAPTRCLIDPLPAPLRDVTFTGGAGAGRQVALAWIPPARAPAGSRIQVAARPGETCPTAFDRSWIVATLPATARAWTDPGKSLGGSHCFAVRIINRSSGGPPAVTRLIERYQVVLPAPTVSAGTLVTDDFGSLTWKLTASWSGSALEAYVDPDHPTVCPTARSDYYLRRFSRGQRVELTASEPDMCVTFFNVSAWDSAGTGTPVRLIVPPPPKPVVGAPQDLGDGVFRIPITRRPGMTVRLAVLTTPCPPTPPPAAGIDWWWGGWDEPYEEVYSDGGGINCALFTFEDEFQRLGPVAMVPFGP